MKWTEIKILTTEEANDAISDMLVSIGAGGVAIEDPNEIRRQIMTPNSLDYADEKFLTSLGHDVTVKAYFHEGLNINEIISLVKDKLTFISQFLDIGKGTVEIVSVQDEDWENEWKKYYKTFQLTDKVVIKPSWEKCEINDKIIVELDPGMAFGTGTHETTKMCSILGEKYVKKDDLVLDVGCGSGILSIIASKLGAKDITAVDIDEVAVRVAKENCQINNIKNINVMAGTIESIKCEEVDIIFANIIADVIIYIKKFIPNLLKKSGKVIVSGIIKERKQDVIDAFEDENFVIFDELEMGEWVAMVFKCQDSI